MPIYEFYCLQCEKEFEKLVMGAGTSRRGQQAAVYQTDVGALQYFAGHRHLVTTDRYVRSRTERTKLMLDNLIRDFDRKRGVKIVMDEDVVIALAKKGYSIEFGAREMRRVLTDTVETYLADYILTRNPKRGETITLKKGDLQL